MYVKKGNRMALKRNAMQGLDGALCCVRAKDWPENELHHYSFHFNLINNKTNHVISQGISTFVIRNVIERRTKWSDIMKRTINTNSNCDSLLRALNLFAVFLECARLPSAQFIHWAVLTISTRPIYRVYNNTRENRIWCFSNVMLHHNRPWMGVP